MSMCVSPWQASGLKQLPVSRILLALPQRDGNARIVEQTVQLAGRCQAHVRAVSIIDASAARDAARSAEAAQSVLTELREVRLTEARQHKLRTSFTRACLRARLDFDVVRREGDPLEVVRAEARYHDLLMIPEPQLHRDGAGNLDGQWPFNLVTCKVGPVLLLRQQPVHVERVLLIDNGSAASGRALRQFLHQNLYPDATLRYLAVGSSPEQAQQLLRDNFHQLGLSRRGAESGFVVGREAREAPRFARHWEADLAVLGVEPKTPLLWRVFGETMRRLIKRTPCAVYAAG